MPSEGKGVRTKAGKQDARRNPLQPGQEIAGVRVLGPTDERVGSLVVYRVQCLGCGRRYKRSAMSMRNHALKGVGCRRCADQERQASRRASAAERRDRVVGRFVAGDPVTAIAAAEGVTPTRVRQILACGVTPAEVVAALAALPPADVLAVPAVAG